MKYYIEQLKTCSLDSTAALNKLLKQLNFASNPLSESDIKNMITSPVNCLFVARKSDNNEIVGMLTLIVFQILFAKKGLLEDFVVDEAHRGKGVGTKLITTALKKAREEEVSYLDFTSRPTRNEANRLYEGLGFKKRNTNVYRIKL